LTSSICFKFFKWRSHFYQHISSILTILCLATTAVLVLKGKQHVSRLLLFNRCRQIQIILWGFLLISIMFSILFEVVLIRWEVLGSEIIESLLQARL